MNTVTVSPKFQVVIPQAVRRQLGVKAGQKLVVFAYENRIVLIPEQPIQAARGLFPGVGAQGLREEQDEAR